jgi:hypothetical protein
VKCNVGEAGEEGFGGDCERPSMERKALVAIIVDVQGQSGQIQLSAQEGCRLAAEVDGRSNKQAGRTMKNVGRMAFGQYTSSTQMNNLKIKIHKNGSCTYSRWQEGIYACMSYSLL